MNRERNKNAETRWPAWLEPLRPDEMSRRRVRNAVLSAATPILRARERSWEDFVARWTSVLAPVAAAAAILFAGLAYRTARPEVEVRVEPVEIDPLLQPLADGPPAMLTSTLEPSMDEILAAAIERD
jgi:hypothetical protein